MRQLPERRPKPGVPVISGAVILAGGGGSRLGGVLKPALMYDGATLLARAVTAAMSVASGAAVCVVGNEPRLRPLLAVKALDAGARGPNALDSEVIWAREEPPGSGPAPATLAGLEALAGRKRPAATPEAASSPGNDQWILLLAADHPEPLEGLRALAEHLAGSKALRQEATDTALALDAVVPVDQSGREQYLFAAYRAAPLRATLATLLGESVLGESARAGEGAKSPGMRACVAKLNTATVTVPPAALRDLDTAEDAAEFGVAIATKGELGARR